MPGIGIPQFERGDRAGARAREPEPAADVGADLQGQHGVQRAPERRLGRRVAVRDPQREGVHQEIDRPRLPRSGRRGPRRLGRLPQAVRPGPHPRAERLEVRGARQAGIERVEAPGGADKQSRGLADAALVEGDLAAQLFDLRRLQRVDRAGLDRDQKLQRGVERAGVALRPRRGEQAARAESGVRRERGRVLEEGGGGRDAAARERAAGRAFQFLGHRLVRGGCRLGAMPGAPVGIEPRVRGLGQRGVPHVPLLRRRRAVGRRAHRRMTEPHLRAELEQTGVDGGGRGLAERCRAARPPATRAAARRRDRPPRAPADAACRRAAARAAAGTRPRWQPVTPPREGRSRPPAPRRSSPAAAPAGTAGCRASPR